MSDMQIRPLSDAQLEAVYETGMMHDFPDTERKPLRMIRDALRRDEYDCLGLFAGEILRGYAFFVRLGRELLLDYFAVSPAYRGTGCGSRFLQMLRQQYTDAETLIIETETPAYAADDADRLTRTRRMQFYLRGGCRETGITVQVFGVEYSLLELPLSGVHTPDEIRAVYARLYQSFLPPERYQRNILIR